MIITLPRKALKYLDDENIEIEIEQNLLEKITSRKIDMDAIKKAGGIWAHNDIDGMEYKKKIRSEWDNR